MGRNWNNDRYSGRKKNLKRNPPQILQTLQILKLHQTAEPLRIQENEK